MRDRNTILVVWLWLLAPAVPAQELAWQIPKRGALEYQRTWHAEAGPVCATLAEARASKTGGKVPERYLPRLAPAPILCQGELAADQRSIADPVRDPRDVLRAVAADFSSRTALKLRLPRMLPFGDLVIGGTWGPVGEDGTQMLRAQVSAKPPAPLPEERSTVSRSLKPFCHISAEGSLVVQRRLDVANGRLAGFAATLDLVVEEQERQYRRFVLTDSWTFFAVRENQDFDFRKRVADAIRRGTAFVADAIKGNKSFLGDGAKDNRSYGSGRLALGLLTLLHGHTARTDPVVQAGFAELRRREIVDSYSLAAALMAMAALYEPSNEMERIRGGQLAALPARVLEPADREAVQRWTTRLLGNIDPRTDPNKVLRFNYVAGPRYDTSLQQYGLLGLWSAHLCGYEVPAAAFAASARHLLAVQCESQGAVRLQLATHGHLAAVAGTEVEPKVPELRVAARGHAYEEAHEPAFGSMTSAGTSGLLLALAGMQAKGHRDKALEAQCESAVHEGYAWLAREFSVRANPGYAERADHHWYYWLYGLERCCELRGIAWLNGRDWYYEGGLQLLAQQQANGSFRTEYPASLLVETTCFAVLFLARSTPSGPSTGR